MPLSLAQSLLLRALRVDGRPLRRLLRGLRVEVTLKYEARSLKEQGVGRVTGRRSEVGEAALSPQPCLQRFDSGAPPATGARRDGSTVSTTARGPAAGARQ